jgi:hypothetical protein
MTAEPEQYVIKQLHVSVTLSIATLHSSLFRRFAASLSLTPRLLEPSPSAAQAQLGVLGAGPHSHPPDAPTGGARLRDSSAGAGAATPGSAAETPSADAGVAGSGNKAGGRGQGRKGRTPKRNSGAGRGK